MTQQTFGSMIATLRKEKGMTQLELAEKMAITDKAVSKWERDLSFPDISALPKLAEILNVTVDELMRVKTNTKEANADHRGSEIVSLVPKGIALAMGIAVVVLSAIHEIETDAAICMLGIGLACLSITQLSKKE